MATSRAYSACLADPALPPNALQDDSAPSLPCSKSEFEMVGGGSAMTRLRMQVQRIGPHFRTMLVSGETGTGKELAARNLHWLSPSAGGPFVMCAAAAQVDRAVKMAHGGTVFFDAIGEMPPGEQVELLRVLRRQESGLAATQRMDLRIVASTREDLKVLAFAGRFQQELYQRLAMVEIALPPLRERREDIPGLAMHLLGRLGLQGGGRAKAISQDAMKVLEEYGWPGNVAELESVLRGAVLRCEGTVVEARHLPVLAEESADGASMAGTARLQDVVEQHVLRVLKSCAGNKLRAAEVLGISRSTLYRMLDAHSIAAGTTAQSGMAKGERYTG
jgi:DNA-binding NtrC family response regulator